MCDVIPATLPMQNEAAGAGAFAPERPGPCSLPVPGPPRRTLHRHGTCAYALIP